MNSSRKSTEPNRAGCLTAFLVPMLVLSQLFGCGPHATLTPTPVPSTPTLTSTPRPTPPALAAGWEGITLHTLCLEVTQTYFDIEPGFSQPLAEYIQKMLEQISVDIIQPGQSCEASLTIQLIGVPLSGSYIAAGRCYTGATIYGHALFTALGRDPLWIPMDETDPVDNASLGCNKPQEAPFFSLWSVAINKVLLRLWGKPFLLSNQDQFRTGELDLLEEASRKVPALIQGLLDPDPYKRAQAASGLEGFSMYGASAIPALQQALSDDDPWVRQWVAKALAAIVPVGPQARDVSQALIDAIHRSIRIPDSSVPVGEVYARAAEVAALERCAPTEQSIQVLIEALGDKESEVQIEAYQALEHLPAALPALIKALDDPNADRRSDAAHVLGGFRSMAREVVPKLTVLLKDEDKIVRRSAIYALENFGPEAITAVPMLIEILHDPDKDLRKAGASALGEIGPGASEAVPMLIEILYDPDRDLREAGVSALGEIGPGAREAVPRLIELLDDKEIPAIYITHTLAVITRRSFGEDRAAWQAWWDQQK